MLPFHLKFFGTLSCQLEAKKNNPGGIGWMINAEDNLIYVIKNSLYPNQVLGYD